MTSLTVNPLNDANYLRSRRGSAAAHEGAKFATLNGVQYLGQTQIPIKARFGRGAQLWIMSANGQKQQVVLAKDSVATLDPGCTYEVTVADSAALHEASAAPVARPSDSKFRRISQTFKLNIGRKSKDTLGKPPPELRGLKTSPSAQSIVSTDEAMNEEASGHSQDYISALNIRKGGFHGSTNIPRSRSMATTSIDGSSAGSSLGSGTIGSAQGFWKGTIGRKKRWSHEPKSKALSLSDANEIAISVPDFSKGPPKEDQGRSNNSDNDVNSSDPQIATDKSKAQKHDPAVLSEYLSGRNDASASESKINRLGGAFPMSLQETSIMEQTLLGASEKQGMKKKSLSKASLNSLDSFNVSQFESDAAHIASRHHDNEQTSPASTINSIIGMESFGINPTTGKAFDRKPLAGMSRDLSNLSFMDTSKLAFLLPLVGWLKLYRPHEEEMLVYCVFENYVMCLYPNDKVTFSEYLPHVCISHRAAYLFPTLLLENYRRNHH
jgi:hypothetical protein